jgi:hypothetical protein
MAKGERMSGKLENRLESWEELAREAVAEFEDARVYAGSYFTEKWGYDETSRRFAETIERFASLRTELSALRAADEGEASDVAAPSVGELEWRRRPPADYGEWYVAGRWDIYKDDGEEGFRLHLEGVSEMPDDSAIVARGLTVEAAQSLANSLQRILSGAAQPMGVFEAMGTRHRERPL